MLIDSKLSVDTLGKIWDLADMDKDGKLDQHEFAVVCTNYIKYVVILFDLNYIYYFFLGYAFSL